MLFHKKAGSNTDTPWRQNMAAMISNILLCHILDRIKDTHTKPSTKLFKGVMTWAKVTSLVCRFLNDVPFRSSMHQNWPQDRKLTQSCWCLHWFLGLRADVWQMCLHVYTRLVVTQVWIEKPCNKNIEIGFQNADFHLCQRASVTGKALKALKFSPILRSNLSFTRCYKGVNEDH